MPDVPCYKGSLFAAISEPVRKYLESGEISRTDAEKFLTAEDFELLDGVIVPSEWYPLASFARMCELVFQTVGQGEIEFLIEQGRESAIRLIDKLGLYTHLNYANDAEVSGVDDPEERAAAFRRDLDIMAMGTALQTFGKSINETDPDHPMRTITTWDVPPEYTETLLWRSLGFRNQMASRHGHEDLWTFERPRPDLVVWRMKRDP